MKRAILFVPIALLASCESVNIGETPQHELSVFCALKSSSLATLLVNEQLLAAGRLLCSLVGHSLGS